ncbi:MAG: alpha/beta hydrolase [bacterium]|nr:alpha/beta hydrolase [bacterium]
MRRIALLTSILALALAVPAQSQQQQRRPRRQPPKPLTVEQVRKQVPADVKWIPDIAYREGHEKWKLDLAMPAERGSKPRPALVIVHGGGWVGGDKRVGQWARYPIEYAENGYVAISVNYRLVQDAPFPACIEDVKNAVRWLRAHATEYNVDPERIGGYGNSAGAHLVALIGLATPDVGLEGDGPYQKHSSALQAVCASATPTDFVNWAKDKEWPAGRRQRTFGENRASYDEIARNSSPITHVRGDAPPFLLFHGTADNTVPIAQSQRFTDAMREAGAKNITYMIIDGASHGVFTRNATLTYPAMLAFFNSTIGADRP